MASQYAGWAIDPEGFFAMGSGPLRARARVEKELFGKLGYAEEAGDLVLRYESVPFVVKHRPVLHLLPTSPAAILDVVMPHISGPELVRQMKTEKPLMSIPVMMMTAEQDPKLSQDSFAAGAVVFLPKPFTTAQFQIMLQMLLGKRAPTGENPS